MAAPTPGEGVRLSPELRDFTTSPRVVLISGVALLIGCVSAVVSLALLRLIGLATNLCFFGRWSTALVSPAGHHLGPFAVLVPVVKSILFVREVMRSQLAVVEASMDAKTAAATLRPHLRGRQRLFPVVGPGDRLAGVLTGTDVESIDASDEASLPRRSVVVAHPDENLRTVVHRMAETGLTRFPVVERGTGRLLGIVALSDLLKARARNLEAERRRERVLEVRWGGRRRGGAARRTA